MMAQQGSALQAARRMAKAAHLRYIDQTDMAGIRREKHGSGFRYLTARGKVIRSQRTLRRIEELVIPPAWTDVWICPDPHGHLQATGLDQRRRKQYLYHPRWREVRDTTKFEKMLDFAQALPKLRKRVNADLRLRGLPRDKVLATVVKLLEVTRIRIGNDEYAESNKSYGLTTLRNRHATVRGAKVCFDFVGKSGVRHEIDIHSPRLAAIIKKCQDLPGQKLFEYHDDDGIVRSIDSSDVNDYLRDISGEDFTAKDFRTWGGTLLALQALQECECPGSNRDRKGNVVTAIKTVAEQLGNTAAVCRKCYIHPAIIDAYLNELPLTRKTSRVTPPRITRIRLSDAEQAVVKLLRRRATTPPSTSAS